MPAPQSSLESQFHYLSISIGFGLLSSAVLNAVIGLISSLPGIITMIQEAPVVLLALLAQTIALQMAGAAPAAVLVTVVVALSLTALLTGVGTWLLKWFKLGDLIRFIPYPVVGGFLAGTGGSFRWVPLAC